MRTKTLSVRQWLWHLLQVLLSGVGVTGVTWMTNNMVSSKPLEWKTLGTVLLTSTAFNLFLYFKQSPLPSGNE